MRTEGGLHEERKTGEESIRGAENHGTATKATKVLQKSKAKQNGA